MSKHSTGVDVGMYCGLCDGEVSFEMGFGENVSRALGKDPGDPGDSEDDLSMSVEWQTQMTARGFNMTGRTMKAQEHGGPSHRKRFYQVLAVRNAKLGTVCV